MNIYICPFMWHNWIGHTIIEFLFTDNKTICLTVESELQILKQYSIIKGFFPGYRIRYIR
ncbi:TPA: hypothetical protein DEP21_05535 [Patescibacteria group bacterium]|nr:hypothetical protein [Candidatus Gracilibacteria bacterium]